MITGIEKLEFVGLYDVTDQFGKLYKHLCFEGFERENDDVRLVVFSDPVSQQFFYFDESISEIVIEFAGIQYQKS
jgi:hypothetical protein